MTTIQPLGTRVLVKKQIQQDGIDERYGIYTLAKSTKDHRHTVLAVGPKCQLPIIPGQTVIIEPTVQCELVTYQHEVVKFLDEKDITAIDES